MQRWKYLIRVLSSEDHSISRDELYDRIKNTGTDRYDPNKKQMFNHFYDKHKVDFFADRTEDDDYERRLTEVIRDFPNKTHGDRKRAIKPDIAIIYDAQKCDMVMNVYDDIDTSDCFRFKGDPRDALVEVRKL